MLTALKKVGRGFIAIFSNSANSLYKTNLIIHDMKARYIKGRDTIKDLQNQIIEVKAQRKVNLDESDRVSKELAQATAQIKSLDIENPNNARQFNVLKTRVESLKSRSENLAKSISQCESVSKHLEMLVAKTKSECEKLQFKIDELESNVRNYKNMKRINELVKVNVEELSDNEFEVEDLRKDVATEMAKFEVVSEMSDETDQFKFVDDKVAMKAYIDSL